MNEDSTTDQSDATESAGQANERLCAELNEAKDRALRAAAEIENVRRRARRELEEQSLYAQAPLMSDLLPVLDNVGRAIGAAEKHSDAAGLLEGFRMVARQLEEVLVRHHCTLIPALHEAFDPHRHQAILQQPSAEYAAGTVLAVAQPGYQLHDRVLRPTQVIVSAGESGE